MISLKSFFIIIYLVLSGLLFLTLEASLLVYSSFFVSNLVLILMVIYHLYYEKDYSPFLSSYIVFNFLFFLAAPISQINSFSGQEGAKLITNFIYTDNGAIYTNGIIILFNLIFFCSYVLLKKRYLTNNKKNIISISRKYLPFIIFILFLVSTLSFIISFSFMKQELFNPDWIKPEGASKVKVLINKKFLFMIPFGGIILCLKYFKFDNKKIINYISIIFFLLIFIGLLFWFKNPLTEKRNALGPIYISLIFLFKPKLLNSNVKILSFLFFSMLIIFPLIAIISHSNATLISIYKNPFILLDEINIGAIIGAFNTLHYDAFFNITASIDYVSKNGFSFGYQLLGGLLFFVPRSIWIAKPVSTGELVGNYLVSDYGFNFNNLSNPFVSEGFINFGIIGIIVFPIILAYVFIKMLLWLKSNNYLKKIMAFYFAIHLIFLLRGDFTNGYAYYIGPLLATVFLPRIIEVLIRNLLKK